MMRTLRYGVLVTALAAFAGGAAGPLGGTTLERAVPPPRPAGLSPHPAAQAVYSSDNRARVPDTRSVHRVAPDLLVVGPRPLPRTVTGRVRHLDGVRAATVLALAAATVRDQATTVGGVDPAVYRSFTSEATAHADALWRAIADGDAAVTGAVAHALDLPLGGRFVLGGPHGPHLRIGAYATTVPGVDVVVDRSVGRRLGMRPRNAMLLAVSGVPVGRLAAAVRRVTGKDVQVRRLGPATPAPRAGRAFKTGNAAARALGSFSYHAYSDGTIRPDPGWVARNIRTERVPILGEVTCNRLMFRQLRGALREIVRLGLAGEIHPSAYGGCYVPRFVDRDPGKPISLHTWGVAIDLNVAENQRGTRGGWDSRVVAIFKKWGFAWGGDWDWTDPMHFQLAGIPRR